MEDYHISREIYFLSKQEKRLIMFSFIQQNQTEWEFVKIEKKITKSIFTKFGIFPAKLGYNELLGIIKICSL